MLWNLCLYVQLLFPEMIKKARLTWKAKVPVHCVTLPSTAALDCESIQGNIFNLEMRKCIFKGEKGINIHSSLGVRTMQAYNTGLSTRESACENDESFCCCFFLHEILSTFVSIASSSLPCNFTASTTFYSWGRFKKLYSQPWVSGPT